MLSTNFICWPWLCSAFARWLTICSRHMSATYLAICKHSSKKRNGWWTRNTHFLKNSKRPVGIPMTKHGEVVSFSIIPTGSLQTVNLTNSLPSTLWSLPQCSYSVCSNLSQYWHCCLCKQEHIHKHTIQQQNKKTPSMINVKILTQVPAWWRQPGGSRSRQRSRRPSLLLFSFTLLTEAASSHPGAL